MSIHDKDTELFDTDILEPMAYMPGKRKEVEEQYYHNTPSPIESPVDSIPEPQPAEQPEETAGTKATDVKPAATRTQAPKAAPVPEPDPVVEARKARRSARRSSMFTTLTDRRTAIFAGVLLIIVAAYLLLVSISYYFQGGADQSIVSNPAAIERVVNGGHAEVKNMGGIVGAWIADVLMSQWLGLGSFILIFWLGAVGLSLVKVKSFKFWNLTSRCLLSAVALSMVLGLVSVSIADWAGTYIYPGGMHGHELNRLLVDLAGWWGALGVSLILITLVLMLFYNDLKAAYRVYRTKMDEHKARVAARRAEQERLAAIEEAERERQRLAQEAEMKKRNAEREEQKRLEEEARRRSMAAAEEARKGSSDEFDAVAAAPLPDNSTATPPVQTPGDIDDIEITATDTISIPSVPLQPAQEKDPALIPADTPDIPSSTGEDTPAANPDDNEVGFEVHTPVVEKADYLPSSDAYDPTAELSNYHFPPVDLLIERETKANSVDATEQEENKRRITKTLNDYGIAISSIKATVGPTVTLYEIVQAEGVRIAKIKRLEDDIAQSLSALGIRIIAPIPGRGTIGIEVPNKDPQTVAIRTIISSKAFQETKCRLPMALGCTISNEVFIADLAKMPHLLVAGATGMGKSVGLNTIIASLLYKKHPSELKFVLVDPKMVEFTLYSKLEKHYLAKLPGEDDAIITDVHKAVATLNSLLIEMENRYALLKDAKQRNIEEYNAKFVTRTLNPDKGHRYLPYIVVIVDEFADLIMQVGKEVETPIARLAQKARAIGIHVILATQRPSTNVITGIIKANFPGRVAFRVFQMVDSRTILDCPGANQLIGRGDMLFSTGGRMERIQCAFIDTPEVDAMCDAIEKQAGYPCPYELPEYIAEESENGSEAGAGPGERDPLFAEIARYICSSTQASTSAIQRRYSIGYNRAGRIMDQFEAAGIVGPAQGGKPRQVLLDVNQVERLLGISDDDI